MQNGKATTSYANLDPQGSLRLSTIYWNNATDVTPRLTAALTITDQNAQHSFMDKMCFMLINHLFCCLLFLA